MNMMGGNRTTGRIPKTSATIWVNQMFMWSLIREEIYTEPQYMDSEGFGTKSIINIFKKEKRPQPTFKGKLTICDDSIYNLGFVCN